MNVGDWVNIQIGRTEVPGVVDADLGLQPVELANGKTIKGHFVSVISFRETNPDGLNPGQTYRTRTPENARFLTKRFDAVVGLDYDAQGNALNSEALEMLLAGDIRAQQARVRGTVAAPVISLTPATEVPAEA